MFLGNGTLNKHAGIDYKQLSLLAKINENQSGEVLYIIVSLFNFIVELLMSFTSLFFYIFLTGSCGKGAGKEMKLLLRC